MPQSDDTKKEPPPNYDSVLFKKLTAKSEQPKLEQPKIDYSIQKELRHIFILSIILFCLICILITTWR